MIAAQTVLGAASYAAAYASGQAAPLDEIVAGAMDLATRLAANGSN